ncbi:MAG: hypothetical protein KF765_04890 [Parvibaculaceae bacterium]|nr:hypothetical protein [Parvibaculaceae bacterium]
MLNWMQRVSLAAGLALPLPALGEVAPGPVDGDETFLPGFSCLAPGAGGTGPITCEARISQTTAPFYFDLFWEMDEALDERVIDRISVREQSSAEPFQEIAGVGSRVYSGVEHNGFEAIDLNFDGLLDFRLLAQTSAGPNTLYRNWLWSPREERFVANEALDEIASPEFDPDTQEITSRWRSSAAEGGTDIYMWEGGSPAIIHRETDRYSETGCMRTYYDRIDGKLAETGTGSCD